MFNNSKILITGGTGSFGKKFIEMSLKKFNLKELVIYSRDEMKQWDLQQAYIDNKKIKFIIGDVRDSKRLNESMKGINYVVHAAATKIVPTAEYNPFECIKTNINGAINVIDAASVNKVKSVIALSTDKACNPVNLYGATKLAADKLFIAANSNNDKMSTKFSVVRYGNVMGSRGSIIPFFFSLKNNQLVPITHKDMTRFMISLEDAVKLVWHSFSDLEGGEIYVKKIPSMKVVDIAKTIKPKSKFKIIGIRPGEKIHEQMIGIEDALNTFEYSDYFKILPSLYNWSKDTKRIKDGKKVSQDFRYASDNNLHWMKSQELQKWLKKNL